MSFDGRYLVSSLISLNTNVVLHSYSKLLYNSRSLKNPPFFFPLDASNNAHYSHTSTYRVEQKWNKVRKLLSKQRHAISSLIPVSHIIISLDRTNPIITTPPPRRSAQLPFPQIKTRSTHFLAIPQRIVLTPTHIAIDSFGNRNKVRPPR